VVLVLVLVLVVLFIGGGKSEEQWGPWKIALHMI